MIRAECLRTFDRKIIWSYVHGKYVPSGTLRVSGVRAPKVRCWRRSWELQFMLLSLAAALKFGAARGGWGLSLDLVSGVIRKYFPSSVDYLILRPYVIMWSYGIRWSYDDMSHVIVWWCDRMIRWSMRTWSCDHIANYHKGKLSQTGKSTIDHHMNSID